MTKNTIKMAIELVPEIGYRIEENEVLADIICSFSKVLKTKGLGIAFYVTGSYSNEKKWGIYSLKKGRPYFSKDCIYLSDCFSSVGKTGKCLACATLLELQKKVLPSNS